MPWISDDEYARLRTAAGEGYQPGDEPECIACGKYLVPQKAWDEAPASEHAEMRADGWERIGRIRNRCQFCSREYERDRAPQCTYVVPTRWESAGVCVPAHVCGAKAKPGTDRCRRHLGKEAPTCPARVPERLVRGKIRPEHTCGAPLKPGKVYCGHHRWMEAP